ncbi:FIST signal transduction protein [uncultured Clostridium sp.]|uniref:FIST signal transduction protein n=1 Tax=uncultured Clostridium sp. TaxID=59620 RepID=UPI0025D9D46E|nr:FIST N-terminal domain-containing protein [uncultured Clostridium sp.]
MVKLSNKFTTIGTEDEVRKIAKEAHMDKVSFVLFFVSEKFDFNMVSKVINEEYPNLPVVGAISQGEINNLGYTDSTITINTIYGDDFVVKPVRLTRLTEKAMVYKRRIRRALGELGIDWDKDGAENKYFAISLIDFSSAQEESLMTMITNTLNNRYWKLAGGSVGDINTGKSAVSINGDILYDAGALILVRTNKKVIVRHENIYKPVGNLHRVTSASIADRKGISADGIPFAELYAKECNVPVNRLNSNLFSEKPIGRVVGDNSYIASPISANNDGSINFYTRVMTGSPFHFMEADNIIECTKNTADLIKNSMKKPELIIGFNCILRYLKMQEEKVQKEVYSILNDVAPYCGFTTLGEQIDKNQVNQTLTYIVVGE